MNGQSHIKKYSIHLLNIVKCMLMLIKKHLTQIQSEVDSKETSLSGLNLFLFKQSPHNPPIIDKHLRNGVEIFPVNQTDSLRGFGFA